MGSLTRPGSLICLLTEIQSIYDRATNRVLLLRLRWPSTAQVWASLSLVAEAFSQGREDLSAVLKILVEKRKDGVEVASTDETLRPLHNVATHLRYEVLAEVESFCNPSGQETPIRNLDSLQSAARTCQKRVLEVLVDLLRRPQRKMSLEDRQSLVSLLSAATGHVSNLDFSNNSGKRASILGAKPPMPGARSRHSRTASLQISTQREPHMQPYGIVRMPSPSEYTRNIGLPNVTESSQDPITAAGLVAFRDPFQNAPDPSQLPILTSARDSGVDPLTIPRSATLPSPPAESPISPMEYVRPKRLRPIGMPFLPRIDDTHWNEMKPTHSPKSPENPLQSLDLTHQSFLSSPLSDSPILQLPSFELSTTRSAQPEMLDSRAQSSAKYSQEATEMSQLRTRSAQLSPFSEPELEASGSYFDVVSPELQSPIPRALFSNRASANGGEAHPRNLSATSQSAGPSNRPLTSTNGHTATRQRPLELPRGEPQAPLGSALRSPVSPALSPSISNQANPNVAARSSSSLSNQHPVSPLTPIVSSKSASHPAPTRPDLPRSLTDTVPVRPHLVTAPSALAQKGPHIPRRQLVISMSSPIQANEDALPQPSAWNDYLGFCVGAALFQDNKPGAMVQTRIVQADMFNHSVINFLKCSNSKCGFQGHGSADKVWESSGVQFRRDFLVKSHCKQKKAKNAIYAYQCIFCVLTRQRSPIIQGTDSFMAHVSSHRGQAIPQSILERTKCIADRKANADEAFDINLMPLMQISSEPEHVFTLEPDVALHSNPFTRQWSR